MSSPKGTPNYGLFQDTQDEFYNVDKLNSSFLTIDNELKKQEEGISNLQGQIENIDVSTDVEDVIDRRVNTDKSKSLNVLINEAKIAILDKLNLLPLKSIWTDVRAGKLDNLNQSLSDTQTNINNNTNTARDNTKSHVTTEINRVITQVNTKPSGIIKSVQRGVLKMNTSEFYKDTAISAVNISKSVLLVYPFGVSETLNHVSDYASGGYFLSNTSLRLMSAKSGSSVQWQIVEFY